MVKKIDNFKVKLADKIELCEPSKELAMAEQMINEDLKEQPSWFAWYAVMQERAEFIYLQAKFALEITEAQADARIRLTSTEKLTEKKIANMVMLDEAYQSARMEVAVWKETLGKIKAVKESFQQRKDCLIALSANMRTQADPSIYIKKEEFSS